MTAGGKQGLHSAALVPAQRRETRSAQHSEAQLAGFGQHQAIRQVLSASRAC
jgi:hypothetical protein